MANQIIIDIGAVANDGTGDPLRTAFGYVNNNFSNIWATGVANSNIQFDGNRILTTNTNGNLVLAPNGIGKVQSNVDIVPNANNTLSLGSLTRQWNTVYAQNLAVGGNVEFNDLTVDGNLTVTGNIIQIGNIVTDSKTIQLANTAATDAAANGSGITVGASDDVATLLYNSTGDVWTTNIGISATGNVTAPYFIGNGALLTGITSYGNANVAAYLPIYNGNIGADYINVANVVNVQNDVFAKRGTFTGDPVTGDASLYIGSPTFTNLGTDVMAQFTGNVPAYAQINLQNYGNSNTSSGDYIITADNGTDSTHFLDLGLTGSNWDGSQPNSLGNRLGPNDGYLYVQDGNFVLGTINGTIETWKFDTTGNLTVPGDIIPVANNTQSLGNATNQWNDLYISNATIFMNGVPISLTAGNVLTVNGADVVTTSANGESSVGNLDISGTVVSIADGAPDTLISITPSGPVSGWAYLQLPTNDTANATDTRLHNDAGNIEFGTGDFSTGETNYTWTLNNTGNLTLPSNGNINGADGAFARFQSVDEGIVRSGVILNPSDGLIRLESWDNENFESFTSADWTSATYVADEGGGYISFVDAPNILNLANSIETSRLTLQVNGGAFLPQNGFNTSGNNITFFVTTAPEDSPETVIDFTMAWTPRSRIEMDYDEGELNIQAQDLDINITSNQEIDIQSSDRIRIENSSTVNGITIATDTANTFLTWTFDIAGNLNLPQGGVVHETNIPYGGLTGKTIALKPSGGTNADQQLMIYPTAGADANHLHLTSGNLYNTELFLGNDDFYVKLANTGNIIINSNDGNSNTAQWTFGTAGTILNSGNLTLQTPSGIPTSVANWQGQGGWNQAFYSNVATTGGTGTGLTVDVAAAGAGYISINDITINTPGTGYTNGDVITIDNENNLPGTFTVGVVVNDWTFDNTGNLTLPIDGYLRVTSGIVGTGASPAPSLSGFSTLSASGNITGGNLTTTGNLVFSSTQVQSSAYAGGNGHAMMIDTNRTDTYEANGSADKPFKTFAAAIAAVATLNPTGTVPYTFVLMGCNINEDVDFTPYNFNFITISTTCRSVFNNPVTFGNSALLQLTVRNVEFANTVTITGDGTEDQLNNTSFYNTTFSGALTVTAANALAFYEAAFFDTVTFNNVNYCYVNGAQFNADWTIRADNTGDYAVPFNGITPGQIIALDFIANDINFVKGGTATYVFQPQASRMGRSAESYALPAGWTLSAYSSVFRGTWTNNGTWAMRNSSNDNAIANVAPTYSGTIGGAIVSASGNISGGNLTVGSGTITGGNVNGSIFNGNVAFGNGTVGGSGNIAGGNISAIGNITGNTAGFAIGYRDIPQVSFTGNATIATTDAGKHFYSTQSSNFTLTIANNASQGFQVGAAITVVNQGTGTISIAQGSGVTLYLAGNATAGNRSVATFGMATIMKVATNTWFINGTGVS